MKAAMKEASPAQHGMWLVERMGIAGDAYKMPLPIEFVGPLDVAALERAWEVVLARHPILTSSFEEVDGTLYLKPGGATHFRYALTQTGPDRHLLQIEAHHLVFDGESKDILVRDLALSYAGQALPPLAPSSPPPGGPSWEWHEPEDPALPGLVTYPRTAKDGVTQSFSLEGFEKVGYTRFEVLFAALHELLVRYGNEQPTIAVDMSTRTNPGEIGLFVNELPVRPDGRGIEACRAKLREVYPFRTVPLAIAPRLAIAPVSISYRRRGPDVAWPGLEAQVDWMAFHGTARNALHVQMVDDGTVVTVKFHYDPACGLEAEQVARDYQAVLRGEELPASRLDGPSRPVAGRLHELVNGSVLAAGGSLTPGELSVRADETAQRLRDLGIGPGDRVAVRMRRTIALLPALLGVLRTGAAYVPIDPAYPSARQTLLLADAQPAALVTEGDVFPLAGGLSDVEGLAYVIYTSGSTGRPKGVAVEHSSVVNLLHAMRDTFGGGGVWLASASFAFDMSVPELWLPLITGGTVVLANEEQTRDAEKLLKLIRTAGVTHVHVPPSTWDRLLEAGFDEPSVVAISGAEALAAPLAARIAARSAELWNLYGPTETTVWSTLSRVDGPRITLGRPLANTQVHVLDEQLRPVPPGIAGELCIGGAGVARGYHNRPGLTGERFVHTRWGRLYRTGDRVRLRGGELEFIGRFDNQIKLRGYRIELGEIEARILEHPGVRAAAVVANPELTAYVVGATEGLKEHLAELLPGYMVPSAYVAMESLPLTPNGKLDRAELPAPVFEPRTVELDGVAKEVFDVWVEVLGRTDFGLDDSLFDLGGHSLTVTKIASRLRKRGHQVPLHIFFDHPTVAGIAAALAEQG